MPTFAAGPGITRFEDEPSHSNGYMVRICRQGKHVNEFFSDGNYGGKRKAKLIAQARYQELCDTLGPPNNRAAKDRLTHRNTTGKVGVHIAHHVDARWPTSEYYAYCASWVTDDGVRQKISFSWKKHGKAVALELATIARDKQLTDREQVLALYEKIKAKKPAAGKAGKKKVAPAKAKPAKKATVSLTAKPKPTATKKKAGKASKK